MAGALAVEVRVGRVHWSPTELPERADLAVIGAGLVGLATAFYAARAGLGRVVVLERREALASLTSGHSAEGFRLEWDAAENIAMVRDSIDVFAHFAEVVEQPGLDVGFRQQGYLFLSGASDEARREARLRERVAWWHAHGLADVEYLDGDAARRRFPFVRPTVREAHFRAADGFVSAVPVARGFAAGGAFDTFLNCPVERIETRGGRVAAVALPDGRRVETDAVVLAAGPFSAQLARTAGVDVPLELRRRHGLVVYLPPGLVEPGWPMVVDADLGMYWRPRPEGLFVGWEQALAWDQEPGEPQDPVPADWRYLAQVREHGRRLTAFWERVAWEDVAWHTGQYVAPLPGDGRPIIGPHPQLQGLFVNTAYEGRGIMASPGGAQLLVRLIQHPSEAATSPFRVPIGGRANVPDQMVL